MNLTLLCTFIWDKKKKLTVIVHRVESFKIIDA